MAISIDWATKIISVPKSYTTLVTLTPFEIRELDIDQFRLDLREEEAEISGMPNLRTHIHNTEIVLGDITLARVIAIINGYTITFEVGNYAVNLVGANSNILDVTNINSVQIRSANSAGLIVVDSNAGSCDEDAIALAVWRALTVGQDPNTFGALLVDLLNKSNEVQHTLNIHSEMLKNKPNNP